MTVEILNLNTQVRRLLGSDVALWQVLAEARAGFCCAVCGQPGDLAGQRPVSVVLLLHGTTRPLVRLTHGWCAEPGVRVTHDPTIVDVPANWRATTWLRPALDNPGPVLLLGPSSATLGGLAPEFADPLITLWRAHGFVTLTDPHAPVADLDALNVYVGRGGTAAMWHRGRVLWEGTIVVPLAWAHAAQRGGRVAVVVAAGLRLDWPHRDYLDHLDDLNDAIGDGCAVAATAHLHTD